MTQRSSTNTFEHKNVLTISMRYVIKQYGLKTSIREKTSTYTDINANNNKSNYRFYFNKYLESHSTEPQYDIFTRKLIEENFSNFRYMATTNIGLTLCGTLKPGKESQDTRAIATAANVGTSIKQKNY